MGELWMLMWGASKLDPLPILFNIYLKSLEDIIRQFRVNADDPELFLSILAKQKMLPCDLEVFLDFLLEQQVQLQLCLESDDLASVIFGS